MILRVTLYQTWPWSGISLAQELPSVRLVEPEGTYLLWLDFRALDLPDKELNDLIVQKAGLWLNAGPMFGAGGRASSA